MMSLRYSYGTFIKQAHWHYGVFFVNFFRSYDNTCSKPESNSLENNKKKGKSFCFLFVHKNPQGLCSKVMQLTIKKKKTLNIQTNSNTLN